MHYHTVTGCARFPVYVHRRTVTRYTGSTTPFTCRYTRFTGCYTHHPLRFTAATCGWFTARFACGLLPHTRGSPHLCLRLPVCRFTHTFWLSYWLRLPHGTCARLHALLQLLHHIRLPHHTRLPYHLPVLHTLPLPHRFGLRLLHTLRAVWLRTHRGLPFVCFGLRFGCCTAAHTRYTRFTRFTAAFRFPRTHTRAAFYGYGSGFALLPVACTCAVTAVTGSLHRPLVYYALPTLTARTFYLLPRGSPLRGYLTTYHLAADFWFYRV